VKWHRRHLEGKADQQQTETKLRHQRELSASELSPDQGQIGGAACAIRERDTVEQEPGGKCAD
jgi:hypothetical protein